jgi:hypothetical protein
LLPVFQLVQIEIEINSMTRTWHWHIHLVDGICSLLTVFVNAIIEDKQISGSDVWVIVRQRLDIPSIVEEEESIVIKYR